MFPNSTDREAQTAEGRRRRRQREAEGKNDGRDKGSAQAAMGSLPYGACQARDGCRAPSWRHGDVTPVLGPGADKAQAHPI